MAYQKTSADEEREIGELGLKRSHLGDTAVKDKWPSKRLHVGLSAPGEYLTGRNQHKKSPSGRPTMLNKLPLEMLDIILQKSYLHWVLNSSTKQTDEDVIRSLISVDVCFNKRITRKRFKKAIWRYLKDFYGKTKRRESIIINNRHYLLENIQPNHEFIASLWSANCITEEQSQFIQRQRLDRDRNAELLYVMGSIDGAKFSNLVKCLRQTNQKTVAKIIDNGGGVVTVELQVRAEKCTASKETLLLHERLGDLLNKMQPRSRETDKLVFQLDQEGLEIIGSQLSGQTVVVWIWCRSKEAFEHIQKLYESNQLRYVIFGYIQPSISMVINIDKNQLEKTIVEHPIFLTFTERIMKGSLGLKIILGMNKLQNEIYVLYRSFTDDPSVIRVFEDRVPFRYKKEKKIKIDEIKYPNDLASSEEDNCLYISEYDDKLFWKITLEPLGQHNIIKWLTTDYAPSSLLVSSDGQLLIFNNSSPSLMIYDSDAELIRSIPLPDNIFYPVHAVETSNGSPFIMHTEKEEEEEVEIEDDTHQEPLERGDGLARVDGKRRVLKRVVSELTRDVLMIIRRFIPTDKKHLLSYFDNYISLNSIDRVFVADWPNKRLILLDSDLNWHRLLCPATGKRKERKELERAFYDAETKHLFVRGNVENEFCVYTLSRS